MKPIHGEPEASSAAVERTLRHVLSHQSPDRYGILTYRPLWRRNRLLLPLDAGVVTAAALSQAALRDAHQRKQEAHNSHQPFNSTFQHRDLGVRTTGSRSMALAVTIFGGGDRRHPATVVRGIPSLRATSCPPSS